ncbi:Abi family protein [Chryseobacterium suipulveris]|uniref:Abi family protein n=1 Tax=Chryseobacterium suipulveris TaxID=2929800 RepID=A0ABY4BVC9_9FLAO|nr:Abi family protein [Chryseobacterium suipulveris]UOE42137.1 Abi family protein [Chryseobacterium suipulveris]
MGKKVYSKPPLPFADQVQLLMSRGLAVPDRQKAATVLSQISYFRLSAYFLPYQNQKDIFNLGTTFDLVLKTYGFDRELRLFVFDCIERIEVAIRTQFIYQLATKYNNAHWQDDRNIFITPFRDRFGNTIDPFQSFQDIIQKAKTHHKPEVFIKHYTDNYGNPQNPPSWMCFELLTIGELSNLYKGLWEKDDKRIIADCFNLHHTVFQSWLHSLTYVRNICAHHARLWNRDLAIEPALLLKPRGNWVGSQYSNNKRTFYFLCILKYLMDASGQHNDFTARLNDLLSRYSMVPVEFLGIPSDGNGNLLDWNSEPLFKN